PDRFAATMQIGIGAIKGTYKGTVQIADKQEPAQYTLAVEGSAAPGFVRGKALMKLQVEDDNVTRLVIDADVQVGGLIASVGQRFVSGIAKQLMRELLVNIEQSLKPETTA
ncbi:MAG TPA: carbon monoxide dehydrogenase, partial [Acidobacteria bacterium]|nr:carbon monoxide dehydrogenase [Acidobacteriota bacterium]